jgi:hypothetical protein
MMKKQFNEICKENIRNLGSENIRKWVLKAFDNDERKFNEICKENNRNLGSENIRKCVLKAL